MQANLPEIGLLFHDMGRPAKTDQPPYGRHLAALRKNAGLSQQQLAAFAGVSQSNIAFWERSAKPPRGEVIPALAKALSVSTEDLLSINGSTGARGRHPGPPSRYEKFGERLAELPRRQQAKILDVAEAMLAQIEAQATEASSS